MMRINLRDVKCKCDACLEAGRIGEEDHIFGQPRIPCTFAPYWEKLLDYYSITFVHAPLVVGEEPDDQDPLKGTLRFEFSESIVSVSLYVFYSVLILFDYYAIQQLDSGTDVWKDVAYGRSIGLDDVSHAQNVQRRNLKHLFRSYYCYFISLFRITYRSCSYIEDSRVSQRMPGPSNTSSVAPTRSPSQEY